MKSWIAIALCAPFVAHAATYDCTTKASKLQKAEYAKMAKVSEDTAKKTALGAVKTDGATISKGGLEVENGCLIYSYDVKLPGKGGVEEIHIDAGNGKVLAIEHEGPRS